MSNPDDRTNDGASENTPRELAAIPSTQLTHGDDQFKAYQVNYVDKHIKMPCCQHEMRLNATHVPSMKSSVMCLITCTGCGKICRVGGHEMKDELQPTITKVTIVLEVTGFTPADVDRCKVDQDDFVKAPETI